MTPASTREHLDRYIAEHMQEHAIPGLSLAVAHHGQLVFERGYGVASVELQAPATPETVYQLQSMTKAFVALGCMMLVEDGRIQLDTPITHFFSDLPPTWATITIRHLLAMTSGIANLFRDHATLADGLAFTQLTTSDAALINWATRQPVHFAPGTYFHYSPTNYHLLGLIIEAVTGQPWHAFLDERIFTPLQMAQTRVVDARPIIPQRAAGYLQVDGQLHNGEYQAPAILGAASGGLYSTVRDLVKWDAALYTEQLVSHAALEQLWTPNRLASFVKDGVAYGLGWQVEQHRAGRIVGHSGGMWTGFSTQVWRFVDHQVTVIVLTNLSGANADQLAKDVAALYLPTS